jgi:hypothetical protein
MRAPALDGRHRERRVGSTTTISPPLLSGRQHGGKRGWEVAGSSQTTKAFEKLFRRNAVTAFKFCDGAQELCLLFGGSNERFVVVTGENCHNGALGKRITVQDHLTANDCASSNSHNWNSTPIKARVVDDAERSGSAAALPERRSRGARDVGWNLLCTPDMGMNLWGGSPPFGQMKPLADGKGKTARACIAGPAGRVETASLDVQRMSGGQDRVIVAGMTLGRADGANAAVAMIKVVPRGVHNFCGRLKR